MLDRLAKLRLDLEAAVTEPAVELRRPRSSRVAPTTNAEKVELFREMFRGREDVFPTRFDSKQGKSGYSPACANKFVRGVCEPPKVKCGECPNQAFTPVSDDAILDHLKGQHVMGVYPMLADETCWFLAVDFDKSTWMQDVRAFLDSANGVTRLRWTRWWRRRSTPMRPIRSWDLFNTASSSSSCSRQRSSGSRSPSSAWR